MVTRFSALLRRAGWLFVFAGAALVAPSAWANQTHFAGPSVLQISSSASFKGGNFAPGTAVTVVVRQPNGAESAHGLMVDSAGKISYTVIPKAAGLYTIRVTDSGGRVLAKAQFNAHQ